MEKNNRLQPVLSTYIASTQPFSRDGIPSPILDSAPELIDFYWKAWEIAWNHIASNLTTPQPLYMDTAFDLSKIWIWDLCFISMYCKYAPAKFPGIQGLDNFYKPIHDHAPTGLLIAHFDMPPLFAWAEYEYARFTGDCSRLPMLLENEQYLLRHYNYIDKIHRGWPEEPCADRENMAERTEYGFLWAPLKSGMDNTTRGKIGFLERLSWKGKPQSVRYRNMLWVDLLGQQALAAYNIRQLAEILENEPIKTEFTVKYDQLKTLLNSMYWSEEDGFYYDIAVNSPNKKLVVRTPASYWPMLAMVCDESQAKKMREKALDPKWFGGMVPWPSLARADKDFNPTGRYWRGGIWMPTTYMCTKALERYNFYDIADQLAYQTVHHMQQTYEQYTPHTIWEAYSPTDYRPSTFTNEKKIVKPDFCGWSGIGPIALLIENVLGFHHVDGINKKIEWRLYQTVRHGIKGLNFGGILTDIVYDDGIISVKSDQPYQLKINEDWFEIQPGEQKIPYELLKGYN